MYDENSSIKILSFLLRGNIRYINIDSVQRRNPLQTLQNRKQMYLRGYIRFVFGETRFDLSQFLDSRKVDGFAEDILIFFVSASASLPPRSARRSREK